ncbi:hypothetical protein BDZ97DRAFT_1920883 [Flammula alnicola]|nr:hypothetical protein BDZ97DRAFT_1920883 [Flammula alnicola]
MTSPSDHSAVVDLLCQSWQADSFEGNVILLNPDGTGEIVSRAEANLWLAAHISWKIVKSGGVQETPAPTQSFLDKLISSPPTSKVLVGTMIEITITKRQAPLSLVIIGADHANMIGGHLFLESAFEPKQFNITVERGEFMAPLNVKSRYIPSPVFGLRMTFDKSPYPPMESWIPEQADMLESIRQFEKTCFVAQRLDDTQRRGGCVSM